MVKKLIQSIFNSDRDKPKAVQCLWISDWEYIGLSIELVFKNYQGYRTQKLIELEYRNFKTTNDLAEAAKRIGNRYAKEYNIELYFPSPDEWSRDCPNWWEAKSAPKCEDCKIPIIPTDSKYLPKEVCYPCHLTRERNERIKNAVCCDDGATMYLFKNGEHKNIGYCSDFKLFPIAPFITHVVDPSKFTEFINVVYLREPDIIKLIEDLEHEIEKELGHYEDPKFEEGMDRFVSVKKVQFKGREIELMNRFNENHQTISRLILSLETAQTALDENFIYEIYFKKGISYREDSILRFIHYVNKGTAHKSSLVKRYKNILTEQELSETLSKLIKNNCLQTQDKHYIVTDLGLKIL